jgi:hypothetical protein
VRIDIAATESAPPSWNTPVMVHFARRGTTWVLVGVERSPQ